ncbi:MAG: ferrochelatase [Desulfobulbaceae bacterium]|nr:ferrochelatase [Desulfobulbaceae bacterium]
MNQPRTGIVLLNMGGPEKQEDVRPFLYNIFSDRQIIRLGPRLLQKPLAWLIAQKRAPKSAATYAQIGGGSPITSITKQQQQALQQALSGDGDFLVTTAMRYWRPFTETAVEELLAARVERIVALSLYPHYSRATTGSSLNELKSRLTRAAYSGRLVEISSWPDQADYISCLAERITAGLDLFADKPVQIVYSAHSLPVSFIEEGDPYVEHLQRTIAAVEAQTGRPGRLCYQSRSGPVEWLSPATPEMIRTLADEGCQAILMVPLSFVSDHVETLYEINIAYRALAGEYGIRLESTPGLNTTPRFIAALRNLVLDHATEG